MSTENTTQATESNEVQATAKLAQAPASTQATQTPAKKAVRKAAKKAPRKTSAKKSAPTPSKAPAQTKAHTPTKAPAKAKPVVAKKPASKPVSKPANEAKAKPVTQAKAKAKPKSIPTAKPVVETKLKKPKMVRDSFTFPKDEYQAIAALKQKALSLKHSAKKSEILRAGLKLMSSLNDKAFLAALTNVPALKTGRPAKV